MTLPDNRGTPSPRPVEVTQVTSLAFYILPFFVVLYGYNLQSGLGYMPASMLKLIADVPGAWVFKLFIILIISFNAVRYFWSAFLVEQLDSFHDVRVSLPPFLRHAEWGIRIACMIFLFMIPVTLFSNNKGHGIELLLIGLYILLLSWDIILLRANGYVSGNADHDSLKRFVWTWTFIEAALLVVALSYLIIVLVFAADSQFAAWAAIAWLSAWTVFLGCIDIWKHRQHYYNSLRRLFVGVIVAVVAATSLVYLFGIEIAGG
jgi:hypothetical protein